MEHGSTHSTEHSGTASATLANAFTFDCPRASKHKLPVRALGVSSMALGFFSLVVFWWFPFSLILASVGLTFGIIAYLLGVKVGDYDNLAVIGPLLCSLSVGVGLTLRFGIDAFLNR